MKLKLKPIVKKILCRDSLIMLIILVLLLFPLWFIITIFAVPHVYPELYDEKIELDIKYTGTLVNWTAKVDLLHAKGLSERSFNLVIANLSADASRCGIWFSLMPWYDFRYAWATINNVTPEAEVDVETHYDGGWVGVYLNYSNPIQFIDITVEYTQSSPFTGTSYLLPYKDTIYQLCMRAKQDIPISEVTIIIPSYLKVETLEPKREVLCMYYQGLSGTIEFIPQQTQERILIFFSRPVSNLIPLTLNCIAVISVINLTFNLYKLMQNRIHKLILKATFAIIAIIDIFILWMLLQHFAF